jgi:hypothetical protein
MNPTINSNFAGDVVEELMTLAVTENEIVEGGHIYIEDNIQYKRNITRVRQSQIIQDMAATPTSHGNISTDERQLEPDPYMVYIEFDPNEFRKLWERWAPTGEFVYTELSGEVQAELLRMLLEGENGVNSYMASAIINGDKGNTAIKPLDKFDGLLKKFAADSDVIDVAAPVALTSGNIIAKLEEVYQAARKPARRNKDWKIFLSEEDHDKYREALVALDYKSIDATQAAPLIYRGKPLVVLTDLPENKMYATYTSPQRSSNLWLGVRGKVDSTTIKVAAVQANSDLWFFKMKMAADTQIKWGQDVVFYNA